VTLTPGQRMAAFGLPSATARLVTGLGGVPLVQALWRAAVLDCRPISAVEAVAVGFMHALDLSCWSQPVNMPHRATLCAPPSSTPFTVRPSA